MKERKEVRIAILGGGASGLMAAMAASEVIDGRQIAVFDRNVSPGKKLLATGNGRCNLSNRNCRGDDYRKAVKQSAAVGKVQECADAVAAFVSTAFRSFGPEETLHYFETLGLMTREEADGRIYPHSGQAASVTSVFEKGLVRRNVRWMGGTPVKAVRMEEDRFVIELEDGRDYRAAALILATGGKAGGCYGSIGDGYRMARVFGHGLAATAPALVQMTVHSSALRGLKGVREKGCVRLMDAAGQRIYAEACGELQFTETALSGICIFDLSRSVQALEDGGCIAVDLFPERTTESLTHFLQGCADAMREQPAEELLTGMVNPKLIAVYYARWCRAEGWKSGAAPRAGQLCPEEIRTLAALLKDWRIPVDGTKGWAEAQVTSGGIPIGEVNPRTMESRCRPGLYLAGELLNVDGPCGGFNLQWAWTSGYLAGRAAADRQTRG